jgi:sugar phosphate isomerase/epimerase
MRFGYGTNGFATHRLDDALMIIADLGYDGVALTLDHGHLDPYAVDAARQVGALADRIGDLGLAVVVETGYDGLVAVELPRHSHVAPDVARRSVDFLRKVSP